MCQKTGSKRFASRFSKSAGEFSAAQGCYDVILTKSSHQARSPQNIQFTERLEDFPDDRRPPACSITKQFCNIAKYICNIACHQCHITGQFCDRDILFWNLAISYCYINYFPGNLTKTAGDTAKFQCDIA